MARIIGEDPPPPPTPRAREENIVRGTGGTSGLRYREMTAAKQWLNSQACPHALTSCRMRIAFCNQSRICSIAIGNMHLDTLPGLASCQDTVDNMQLTSGLIITPKAHLFLHVFPEQSLWSVACAWNLSVNPHASPARMPLGRGGRGGGAQALVSTFTAVVRRCQWQQVLAALDAHRQETPGGASICSVTLAARQRHTGSLLSRQSQTGAPNLIKRSCMSLLCLEQGGLGTGTPARL